MLTIVSHEECETHAAALQSALNLTLENLRNVKRDRDEWKQQHENLLVIYRTQSEELARVRAQVQHSGGGNG